MKLNITVTPSTRFKRNLDVRYLLGGGMREYMEDVSDAMRTQAISRAPKDRGTLIKSHRSYIDRSPIPKWAEMRVEEPTAIYVHEGTKPHWAPVRALAPWALRHGINPWALQRSIARKGTKANRWIDEAKKAVLPYLRQRAHAIGLNIQSKWSK